MDGYAALRFILGLGFLGYASFSDLRTRRVPDSVWVVLGVIALIVLATEFIRGGSSLEHDILLIPTAIIFFAVFFGEELWTEEGFRPRPLRLSLYALAAIILLYLAYHFSSVGGEDAELFWAHFSMPVLLVLAHVFYQFGLLRGGADAKAFMTIALLVPAYPVLEAGLPFVSLSPAVQQAVDVVFPFALVVLLDAALLLIFLPLVFLLRNAFRRDVHGVESLFGYRVNIDKVPRFVWLMDRIEDGRHVRVLLPRRRENREEQVRQLREKGFDKVWVTPQIPFLLPMAIGFIAAFLVGNFMVGLTLLMPH